METDKIIRKISQNPPQIVNLYIDTLSDLLSCDNYAEEIRLSLNEKVNDYLLEEAKNITINHSIKIIIHAKQLSNDDKYIAARIIRDTYKRKTKQLLRERKKKSHQWRIRLLCGIIFLALCHGISLLFSLTGDTSFSKLMQDSFEIMGWVAVWEPALYFLFTRKEETYELSDYLQLENAAIIFIVK